MMHASPTAMRGFTLLELLVALAIFGFVSVIAYTGLTQVLQAQQSTELTTQQLAQMQRAFHTLQRDLLQASERPIRGEYAQQLEPLLTPEDGITILELTRRGWSNPAQHPRSELQRIAYSVVEGQLIRQLWYVLDRAQDSASENSVLIDGVTQVSVRFLQADGEWSESWPTLEGSTPRPEAVEVVIDHKSWGRLRRLMRVAG